MTLPQITSLTDKSLITKSVKKKTVKSKSLSSEKPMVPSSVEEFYINSNATSQKPQYIPNILGIAKLHFVDSKNKIDEWVDFSYLLPFENDGKDVDWEKAVNTPNIKNQLGKIPLENSTYKEIPSEAMQEKSFKSFEKDFSDNLYQNQTLTIFRAPMVRLTSKAGETEGDFRIRVAHTLREKRDELISKLREKYSDKITTLTNKVRRSQDKLVDKQQKVGIQKVQTVISAGEAILGAIFGRRDSTGTITRTGSTLRRGTQIGKDSRAAAQAEAELKANQYQLEELQSEMNREISELLKSEGIDDIPIEKITIRPRKSDIVIEKVVLVWKAQ